MSKKYIIPKEVKYNGLILNQVIREIKINDHFIDLTAKEYKIMAELVVRGGEFIAKDEIFKKV